MSSVHLTTVIILFTFLNILTFAGAIGLFIYGMKRMSDILQKIAGQKMRQFLSALTSNKLRGLLTGTFITALLQTSSATTVMIVSFVNAGLLSLTQSIPLILGANIGTTLKVWLVSIIGFKFQLGLIALPLIGLSVPFLFFGKTRWRLWAEFFIGFSVLLLGLGFLKLSVPDIENSPETFFFLTQYTDMGLYSLLIFVFYGMFITAIIQSSSVTITLTLVMCYNGWIPFEMALAMVLGENIGTTVTANIAAIVANKNAKRAALSHFLINLFGVVVALLFFKQGLSFVKYLLDALGYQNPYESPYSLTMGIAIYHSAFNIVNALILLPLTLIIVNLSLFIIKNKLTKKADDDILELSSGFLFSEMSVLEAEKTLKYYFLKTKNTFDYIPKLINRRNIADVYEQIFKARAGINLLSENAQKIKSFLNKLSQKELSNEAIVKVNSLQIILHECNVLNQNITHLLGILEEKNMQKAWFNQELRDNLNQLSYYTENLFRLLYEIIEDYKNGIAKNESALNFELNDLGKACDNFNKVHIENIQNAEFSYASGIFYSSIIYTYKNIQTSFGNIYKALCENGK